MIQRSMSPYRLILQWLCNSLKQIKINTFELNSQDLKFESMKLIFVLFTLIRNKWDTSISIHNHRQTISSSNYRLKMKCLEKNILILLDNMCSESKVVSLIPNIHNLLLLTIRFMPLWACHTNQLKLHLSQVFLFLQKLLLATLSSKTSRQ